MKKRLTIYDILPILAGILFTIIILILFSKKITVALDFLIGTVTSKYYFGAMVNTACLLMVAALGNSIVLKIGEFNLGGEGQIYVGGFIAAIILSSDISENKIILLLIAFLSSLLVPSFLMIISALLKHLKNANILLTSFLVSAATIPFIDSFIAGAFRGNTNNLLATSFIKETVRFKRILSPSPLSSIALIAPLLCIFFWYIIYRTVLGRKIQIIGISKEFASYCGYPQKRIMYGSLCIAGALHGFTGFIAVAGTYYTCHSGFYSGIGWNALSVALISNSNPILIIPSSFALSLIFSSANRVALNNNFGFDIGAVIQGIMLSFIAIKYIKRYKK